MHRTLRQGARSVLKHTPGVYELMPGGVALGLAGDMLKTLLGSCVAVILTDPRRTVGAMCHIVHIGRPNAANAGNTAYGICAMEDMFGRLRDIGISHRLCHAYVFGGGNMFPQHFKLHHVGASNVNWVLDYLASHHIGVVDQCLGGMGYRKISWTVGPAEPAVEVVVTKPGILDGN